MEPKKAADYANLTESEKRGELETRLGELYDKWHAAGLCGSYPPPSGRESFVKASMDIIDKEIELRNKEKNENKNLPAVVSGREITKYEKLASKE